MRIALWLSLWIFIPLRILLPVDARFSSPQHWWHWLTEKFPPLLWPVNHHWVWIFPGLILRAGRLHDLPCDDPPDGFPR